MQRAVVLAVVACSPWRRRSERLQHASVAEHLITIGDGVNIIVVPDDKTAEALRDVIGILRAWYRAEQDPSKRRRLAQVAKQLTEALGAMHAFAPGTPEYQRANFQADSALNAASSTMHFNEAFAPILGAASNHLRKVKASR